MRRICLGNGLLLLCSLFYLAWWILAFKPENKIDGIGTKALLVAASICGLAALILTIMGTNALPRVKEYVSTNTILIGGVVTYSILLLITSFLLKRQVTSELFLIIGWAVLELYMINALYGAELLKAGSALLFAVVLLVAAIISLVCYILYYRLTGTASYIDGMIPLVLVAVVMVLLEIRCIDI